MMKYMKKIVVDMGKNSYKKSSYKSEAWRTAAN